MRTVYAMLRLVDDEVPRPIGYGDIRRMLLESDLGCAGLSIQSVRVAHTKRATLNGNESTRLFREERILKITGAIECLEQLIEHCHAHTFDVDEEAVVGHLESTREALKELQNAKEEPPPRKPIRHSA